MPKSTLPSKAKGTKIPPEQFDLPVSFDPAGEMVTLREIIEGGKGPVRSLAALSPEKRSELTIKRLEMQPDLELAMVGAGLIDRDRAIREVKAQTEVGRALSEIEQIVIQDLLDEVAGK